MSAPARRAAFQALVAITRGELDMDAALERARAPLGDPRDVALLRELVTGTLRWQGRLDWTLASFVSIPWPRLDDAVAVSLRLGAYQLEYLDRVPARAVVDDAVSLVKAARVSSAAGLVNAVLRRFARGERRPLPTPRPEAPRDEHADALAVATAHPAWLVRRWLAREAAAEVDAWLAFDNVPAPTTLRVNPLGGLTRAAVVQRLADDGVVAEPTTHAPLGLVVRDGQVVTAAALRDGFCHIQDEGSQVAALVAPVHEGDRVLDLCAAPGGKTLAYAAAAGTHGTVVASDVRPARLAVLSATVQRGRATRASVVAVPTEGPLPFAPVFDVVAVDAPCSGLGTLRRDPDIKWRRRQDDLGRLHTAQVQLLRRAAALVVPGGTLVYTTCSLEPEETADVVAEVRDTVPGLALRDPAAGHGRGWLQTFVEADGYLRLRPGRHGLEGYFGALLTRG